MTARLHNAKKARAALHAALEYCKASGLIRLEAKVRACLKSAEGAVRHAERLQGKSPAERRKMKRIRVHRRKDAGYRAHTFGHDNTAYFPTGAFHP